MLDDAARSIRCWGGGGYTGDGTATQREVQVSVSAPWATMMPPRIPFEIRSSIQAGVTVARVSVAGGPDELWYWGYAFAPIAGSASLEPALTTVPGGAVDALHTSGDHACFVRGGGVFCYGSNGSGQSGQPASATVAAPTQVPGITSARDVFTTSNSTVALLTSGTALAWGAAPQTHVPQFLAVAGDSIDALTAQSSGYRIAVVTTSGRVFVSERPDGSTQSLCEPALCNIQPTLVALGAGELASSSIASNDAAVCVVLRGAVPGAGGEVRCRGRNTSGELGDGSTTTSRSAWRTVLRAPGVALTGAVKIAAGATSFCVTTASSSVYCWGDMPFSVPGDGGPNTGRLFATPILWP